MASCSICWSKAVVAKTDCANKASLYLVRGNTELSVISVEPPNSICYSD